MKKLLSVLFFLLEGAFVAYAQSGVANEVTLQIIKEREGDGPRTKAPRRPLVITQNDHALTIPVMSTDYTLELCDEIGTVVYTTFVPKGTTSITLPSALAGDFELRLVADTYYYIGYITL